MIVMNKGLLSKFPFFRALGDLMYLFNEQFKASNTSNLDKFLAVRHSLSKIVLAMLLLDTILDATFQETAIQYLKNE